MTWLYEYATLTVDRDARPGAVAEAAGRVGTPVGVWRGQIGVPTDRLLAMTAWPGGSRLEDAGAGRGAAGVLRWESELLEPTARPDEPSTLQAGGVYAHRWFGVASADLDEFVALSAGAWPAFEDAYDARIVGLWRSRQTGPGEERVLLVTRYGSLAVWEQSRGVLRDGGTTAREAGERFVRRRELTRWTGVVTTELVAPG